MDEETPLVDEQNGNDDSQARIQALDHARDVHILSWAFLLIFLAYGAAQNLESTINTDGDLGTTSLGILYSSFTVFSLTASFVVRVLGSKNALVLGTTGYWLFIAANLKPTWAADWAADWTLTVLSFPPSPAPRLKAAARLRRFQQNDAPLRSSPTAPSFDCLYKETNAGCAKNTE